MMLFAMTINIIAQFCSPIVIDETLNKAGSDFSFYFTYGITFLIVAIVSFLTIKYLLQPDEKSPNHIKRRILSDD